MAETVIGMGASHTPLLTLESHHWAERASADYANQQLNLSDGRRLPYEQLLSERGPRHQSVVTPEILKEKALRCGAALDRMARALSQARPDLVIIVGDDQRELFDANNQPVLAIFHGQEVVTSDKFGHEDAPEWIQQMGRGYLMDDVHRFPGAPEFALDLIRGLMARDVDVATIADVPEPTAAGFGHAYGFVIQRLMASLRVPVVPVLLNTYYPPNVPSARRTYAIGRAFAQVIRESASAQRVAVIASGGLSHFVVDEELDRRVLDAFERKDADYISTIPETALLSGSSEILNWILAAGVVADLPLQWHEYHPLYRTPAGTGVGAGFAVWQAAP